MSLARRALTSEAEFLALPESTDKVELVDGEIIVSPSPSRRHQDIVRRIVVELSRWSEARSPAAFVGRAPLDVRFGAGRILQPDVFVVLGGVDLDEEGPIDRVPDLCVEVVSKDRLHDRVTKRYLYAAAGVREYWLVEPVGLIERHTGDGLETVEEITENLTTSLLPDFTLRVGDLLGG